MGTSFWREGAPTHYETCSCGQDDCFICQDGGKVAVGHVGALHFNMGNTALICGVLGIDPLDGTLTVEEIPAIRRRIVRALANKERLPYREGGTVQDSFIRDGAIARGPRIVTCGISQEGVAEHLRNFDVLLADAQVNHSKVHWG